MVIKRTGDVVPFDVERIKDAIMHASRATKYPIEKEVLRTVVDGIVSELKQRFVNIYPNVENIQDLVEKHLILNDLVTISKEYILYRAKRKEEREHAKQANIEKSLVGKLKVQKRDGRTVIFDIQKVRETLTRLAGEYADDIDHDLVLKEFLNNIYDGIKTSDIEKALVLATTAFIENDPSYSWVAGRVFLQRLYKEVLGKSVDESTFEATYKDSFAKNITLGVQEDLFAKDLLDYDLEELAAYIEPERDKLLQYIGVQTLYERYFQKTQERRVETPQYFWMRVAMGLALNEKKEQRVAKVKEFYDVLSQLYFVSSTPTLFHSGTPRPQLSSCYLNTVIDDLTHIFKVYGDNAQLSKWSGGIGTDWTNVRGTGAWISTTKVESQGTVPFLKIANDVTAAINRSGKRRGATCAYLETWHYDIEDFLDLRKNTGDDRRRTHDMNTANWIPDLFMQRVKEDGEWTLFSPDETPELHHIYGKEFKEKYEAYEALAKEGKIRKFKTLSAVKLWRKMISMLFETGHPWITFKDPCNVRSPQDHAGVIHNSNLCTEITLNTSEDETAVCNLGSINLSKHAKDGAIDFKRLEQTVKTAISMLDNVIDINYYPTKEAENSNMKHRPIGLGIMGIQDLFFKLDLAFDSEKAEETSDELQEFIAYHAILSSSIIAKEKGSYQSFKGSKWDRNLFPQDTIALLEEERGQPIPLPKGGKLDWKPVREHVKEHGMRNSNVMAIAPTATISTIAGCFPTIEPIYKNIYVKANMSGEFTIVNEYLIEDLKKLGKWNNEMLEQLKYYDGDVSMISGLPDELKLKYKESFQVDPQSAIRHTARRAKWIDQSQSHNVFIKGTSGRLISETYQYAWEWGLKTTYYLRTLGATQIEKSTLDAKKYGFTQKREYQQEQQAPTPAVTPSKQPEPKLCRIEDPDCEACQ